MVSSCCLSKVPKPCGQVFCGRNEKIVREIKEEKDVPRQSGETAGREVARMRRRNALLEQSDQLLKTFRLRGEGACVGCTGVMRGAEKEDLPERARQLLSSNKCDVVNRKGFIHNRSRTGAGMLVSAWYLVYTERNPCT